MSAFRKMQKIRKLADVRHSVAHAFRFRGVDAEGAPMYDTEAPLPILRYEGSVKIHGTNGSILRVGAGQSYGKSVEGDWLFQSKSRTVTPQNDNLGFAAAMVQLVHIGALESFYNSVVAASVPEDQLAGGTAVVYGEWAGEGIQKGVGVSNIGRKVFVAFDVAVVYEGHTDDGERITKHFKIQNPCVSVEEAERFREVGLFTVHDFPTYTVDIDFNNVRVAAEQIDALVEAVEKECPVAKALGAEGIGEGIVFRCVEALTHEGAFEQFNLSDGGYWFKAKGEAHKHTKSAKAGVEVDYAKLASVDEFATAVVTPARIQQALDFLRDEGLPIDKTSTGLFVKWVLNDVLEEEQGTMAASELDFSDIRGAVGAKARNALFAHIKEIEYA